MLSRITITVSLIFYFKTEIIKSYLPYIIKQPVDHCLTNTLLIRSPHYNRHLLLVAWKLLVNHWDSKVKQEFDSQLTCYQGSTVHINYWLPRNPWHCFREQEHTTTFQDCTDTQTTLETFKVLSWFSASLSKARMIPSKNVFPKAVVYEKLWWVQRLKLFGCGSRLLRELSPVAHHYYCQKKQTPKPALVMHTWSCLPFNLDKYLP